MGRDSRPYAHQLAAWQATLGQGRSCLVTAGTGAGKTECFLVPVIDDLLRQPRRGGGVRAILVYALNALIESQRERLAAWVEGLGGRVRFALFNGDTPETARRAGERSTRTELKCRKDIRESPPEEVLPAIAAGFVGAHSCAIRPASADRREALELYDPDGSGRVVGRVLPLISMITVSLHGGDGRRLVEAVHGELVSTLDRIWDRAASR